MLQVCSANIDVSMIGLIDSMQPPQEVTGSSPGHRPGKPTLLWHVYNREGYNPLKLYHPYDVTFICNSRVAVVEGFYPYSRVQVLGMDGRQTMSIAQGDILPYGITMDTEGYMAITDHKDRTVKFFTPDGDTALSWAPNMFDWPDGIAATKSGEYVVTDKTRGMVSVHDIDGVIIKQFSSTDPIVSQFSCPAYVATDNHRRIIVTDTFDHSVKVFDMGGKLLQHFGSSDTQHCPQIKDPRGVTIDSNNNIVVADWGNNSVNMYSPDGRFMSHLLSADDNIKYPWGVAMNSSGQLLISEQKLNSTPGLKLYRCH